MLQDAHLNSVLASLGVAVALVVVLLLVIRVWKPPGTQWWALLALVSCASALAFSVYSAMNAPTKPPPADSVKIDRPLIDTPYSSCLVYSFPFGSASFEENGGKGPVGLEQAPLSASTICADGSSNLNCGC